MRAARGPDSPPWKPQLEASRVIDMSAEIWLMRFIIAPTSLVSNFHPLGEVWTAVLVVSSVRLSIAKCLPAASMPFVSGALDILDTRRSIWEHGPETEIDVSRPPTHLR